MCSDIYVLGTMALAKLGPRVPGAIRAKRLESSDRPCLARPTLCVSRVVDRLEKFANLDGR